MKYKIVGIFLTIYSSIYSLVQLGLLFFVYPKMFALYAEMDAPQLQEPSFYYSLSVVFLGISLSFLYVGLRLLKSPSERFFKVGVAALALILMLSVISIAVSIIGLIAPVYTITSSL